MCILSFGKSRALALPWVEVIVIGQTGGADRGTVPLSVVKIAIINTQAGAPNNFK